MWPISMRIQIWQEFRPVLLLPCARLREVVVSQELGGCYMGAILQKLLSISPIEVTFARRGFHDPSMSTRNQLERVGESFLRGYHFGLVDRGAEWLASCLDEVELEFRGFGY